jgi:hypothetical protein
VPDASLALMRAMPLASGQFAFQYRQRKNLGDVSTVIQNSTNLVNWSIVQPLSVTNVSDLGEVWLQQAIFPAQSAPGYFRMQYLWPGAGSILLQP